MPVPKGTGLLDRYDEAMVTAEVGSASSTVSFIHQALQCCCAGCLCPAVRLQLQPCHSRK